MRSHSPEFNFSLTAGRLVHPSLYVGSKILDPADVSFLDGVPPSPAMEVAVASALAVHPPPDGLVAANGDVSVDALRIHLHACLWCLGIDPKRRGQPVVGSDGRLVPNFIPWFQLLHPQIEERVRANIHLVHTSPRSIIQDRTLSCCLALSAYSSRRGLGTPLRRSIGCLERIESAWTSP